MRKIAVIDADLIGRKRHRFPNLVCMKLSGYHKDMGAQVVLKTDYENLDNFDKVYVAKVFTDTQIPSAVLSLSNVKYGGTGFFYDKAVPLPIEIEHHKPDYHLYDDWVKTQLVAGKKAQEFRYYTDYSIGYLTRGCFRHCEFCVNQNYNQVKKHSPLFEFLDEARKKICLLDDNFLGCPEWKSMLMELRQTSLPFQFKQGLDERLLTEEICALLFTSKYDGDYIFAFDNFADSKMIQNKIRLLKKYTHVVPKFYCFTGYDRDGKWDAEFWHRDLLELIWRIEILMKHSCLPYVMRYCRYVESPYRGMYITLARWCNQPAFFKKKSLGEYVEANGKNSASYRYLGDFKKDFPEAAYFLDLKFRRCNLGKDHHGYAACPHRQARTLCQ